LDTLQLKLFLSLSKTLNFTKTANEFYVTQPTVSNYLKNLENSLGVSLLKRDSHSVSLTAEGREFVEYATQILSLQDEAESRMRSIAEGRHGYIRVAMLSSAADIFTMCLHELTTHHPGVQVNVSIMEGQQMMSAVCQGNYDIYFANLHMIPESTSIDYIVNPQQHLNLFVHKDICDKIDMNDWNTLSGYHFISAHETDCTLSAQIKKICANRGYTPDIINYYNRADAIFLAVNAGIGISILPPKLNTFYNCPNVVGLPIVGDDAAITSVVAWHKNTTNPDVQTFLKLSPLAGHAQPNK